MSPAHKLSRPFRQHFHAVRKDAGADRPLEDDIIHALDQLAVASRREREERDARQKALEAARRARPEAKAPATYPSQPGTARPFRFASLAPAGTGIARR
ncbi:hypothetical protein [Hyphomonas sp.]|uniref:hypothetical protein n=1 Tax=Hyphomonas sp. TaxID=87 RepID=UPI00391A4AA6